MADADFDVIYVGAGPGGYVSAIRAAQLGLEVAVVERRPTLGGTCLNVGCIPSKSLLQSSLAYHTALNGLAAHGVKVEGVALDLKTMMARKAKIVADLTKGVGFLFKKNDIERFEGWGRIVTPGKVEVTGADGEKTAITGDAIVVATGSESAPLPGVEVDETRIVTSTGALELPQVPKHLVVVGAGVIGLELGSAWRRLGAEVTFVEFLDRIAPGMDGEIAKAFQRALSKQGLKFKLATKVVAAKTTETGVTLTVAPVKGGDKAQIKADVALVAIGRRPFTDGLGLDDLDVARDRHGFITVDDAFQTSAPGVYAIGDCIRGPMLAHKAEDEGMAVAEILGGEAGHVNYDVIPSIVYTHPEVAWVGKTEDEVKAAGVDHGVGKFPFMANSRARCMGESEGMVKIIADKASDRVLGAHIMGPEAGDMIHEIAVAMEFAASAEDIARTCHGHPTLNEAVREAALAVDGRAIHV